MGNSAPSAAHEGHSVSSQFINEERRVVLRVSKYRGLSYETPLIGTPHCRSYMDSAKHMMLLRRWRAAESLWSLRTGGSSPRRTVLLTVHLLSILVFWSFAGG